MISRTDIEDMTYVQDEALLPCPFCGEIPELEFLEVLVNFRCPPVSSCNGTGLIICCTKDNLERAITAWNRRAAPARPSQAGDERVARLIRAAVPFAEGPDSRNPEVLELRAALAAMDTPKGGGDE